MAQRKSLKERNKSKRPGKAKWVFIVSLLVIFWITLSVWNINKNLGTTVLTYDHSKSEIITRNFSEILAGNIIKGEFSARDKNLGIVAVRFNTFFRINEDVVEFRIKEKGTKNWYYKNSYTTPQFQPSQYFTFGFPIIPNSEGKKYYFEIESAHGVHENAVALSAIEPIFETKYQYSKTLIMKDLRSSGGFIIRRFFNSEGENYAVDYIVRKLINIFTNVDFLISSIVYFMPLFLYIVWLLFFKKYLFDEYYLIFMPVILMILSSILNITGNDTVIIGLTSFWFFVAFVYKLKSYFSFIFSLVLIIMSPLLLYTSLEVLSVNFTVWGYLFLVVGVLQQIIELSWKDRELIGFLELRKALLR